MDRVIEHEYSNQTTLSPLGALIIIIVIVLLLTKKKDYVYVSFVIIGCFVSSAQRIVIVGLDFTFIRIIVLFSFLRIILRNEWQITKLHIIDKLVIAYAIVSIIAFTISRGGSSAIIRAFGDAFDTIGTYFIFRNYVTNYTVFSKFLKLFAISSLIVMPFFLFESLTGLNNFSYFGGVPLNSIIREGRVRSQGAFAHPIIAGTFWAVLIPLFWGQWKTKNMSSFLIIVSTISSLLIIQFCASSTPIMSIVGGILFFLIFPFRKNYSDFKIMMVAGLILLQLSMDNPIWFAISFIDIAGGSTGFFRFLLIDKFVENWKEWFLFGIPDTYHWGAAYRLPSVGLRDLTNRFVAEGVFGGIGRLSLFLVILVSSIQRIEKKLYINDKIDLFIWALLSHIVVHFMNFWGVTYFGQMSFMYWLTIAICVNIDAFLNFFPIEMNQPNELQNNE